MWSRLLLYFGRILARFLTHPAHIHRATLPPPPAQLLAALQVGDVLLVEGDSRISGAIKYLSQSSWSHAALYVGTRVAEKGGNPEHMFVEADIKEGVRSVSVDEFKGLNARICRPVGLTVEERVRVADFVIARIGHQYDIRNVFDLARFLIRSPIAVQLRRKMLVLGSGDPTRAICSTLVAQAFQSLHYPILPIIDRIARLDQCPDCIEEIIRVQHHSLYVPRDFDLSPYFQGINPSLITGFDYKKLTWDAENGS